MWADELSMDMAPRVSPSVATLAGAVEVSFFEVAQNELRALLGLSISKL